MAIGIYVAPGSMTAERYNEAVKLLRKAGAGHPSGRSYHACFGEKDKLMVFDVWTSQAAFEKFGKTLMPILQQLGVEGMQPNIMPIHNVIVPPSKTKLARKPAKAAKSAKRSKKR
jgi:hypothetical protein